MHVRTDDDIYRVDSVWLGPPRATFPWRVRYIGYGVGLIIMMLVMFVQRRVGIGLDFFSVAWALLITVLVTRFVGARIDYERPLGQVLALFGHEVRGPRRRTAVAGGPVRTAHVRVHPSAFTPGRRRPARQAPAAKPTKAAKAAKPAAPDPWARRRREPGDSWPSADRRRSAERRRRVRA
ncbi:hypothetical protein [Pseudonocardia sp.]|uniref:hypothetical protein n=1 Tax=Pseudonocardia sp. TaxID=60912 RepID=UPI003D096DB2